MTRTTPFHDCLAPFNQTKIWKNWSGYLVAPSYIYSIATEYYAIRNAVSLFDTSPLFKYEFKGCDARRFLEHAMARDIRECQPGKAQYTAWCNDEGFVIQDGVIICLSDDHFRLTSAEPALRYFRCIARNEEFRDCQIDDISERFGILALQGPHAHDVLCQLTDDSRRLRYFEATEAKLNAKSVVISRTGYTGDLGYEIWVGREDAKSVWDMLIQAGSNFNIIPIGTTALKMARVEAGLLLMGVDFYSAKFAWVNEQRETPNELGWAWMFRKLEHDARDFIGREAIERENANHTNRWQTVGLEIDWHDYQRVHEEAGITPPMHEVYLEQTMSLYRCSDIPYDYAGFASSFLFSSLLKKPIAIAKLPADLVAPETEITIELTVIRKPVYVKARVAKMPFFNPPRKSANVSQ